MELTEVTEALILKPNKWNYIKDVGTLPAAFVEACILD